MNRLDQPGDDEGPELTAEVAASARRGRDVLPQEVLDQFGRSRPALPARIEEIEPGQWCVTFADLPEALTGDTTFEAARVQAADALATALDGYVLLGRPFPASRSATGAEILITPSW